MSQSKKKKTNSYGKIGQESNLIVSPSSTISFPLGLIVDPLSNKQPLRICINDI